jgi:acyl-CoA reductase-like NAD-dependent aldehyde dehydrogenase
LQSNRIHRALSSKIEEVILQHLDRDTIAFVERLPEQLHGGAILIDQTGYVQAPESSARVVALVDRSSDVASAARSIVHARIAFRGQSPYAPDIALVNEFTMEEFIQAAKVALSEFVQETKEQEITALQSSGEDVESAPPEKELRDSGADVVMRGELGTIAIVEKRYEVHCHLSVSRTHQLNRSSSLLQKKIYGACLIVHPIRSLDDGIDFANLQ